jgi:hypothetical protein
MREHRGIHRPCRRAGNRLDLEPRLLQQPIEHAPSEGAMRSTALKGEINRDGAPLSHVRHALKLETAFFAQQPSARQSSTYVQHYIKGGGSKWKQRDFSHASEIVRDLRCSLGAMRPTMIA